jgi:ABC-type phosphate transport system auxiliary subunit
MASFAALIAWSSAIGTPHSHHVEALPAIALGSRLLFHVERAAAILALVGVVVLVGWRGAHGEWPIKFGNVEYAPKEAVKVTADALAKQDKRLRRLEDRVPRTMQATAGELTKFEGRLRRLEDRVPRAAELTADALTKQEQRLRILEERIEIVDRSPETG